MFLRRIGPCLFSSSSSSSSSLPYLHLVHRLLLPPAPIHASSHLPLVNPRIDLSFSHLFASLCVPPRFAPQPTHPPLISCVSPDPSLIDCETTTTTTTTKKKTDPSLISRKKKKRSHDAAQALSYAEILSISESLQALGVEKRIIERIVDLQQPSLLPKVQLLLGENFTSLQVGTLVTQSNCRAFVAVSYERVLSVINVLKARGLTGKDAGRTLTRNPSLFVSSVENLERNLKFFEDLEMGKEALKRIMSCRSRPFSIVHCAVGNLQKHVAFLQGIGMDRQKIRTVIHKFPQLLVYNIEANLEPKVKFFEAKGMDKDAICSLVRTRPECLALSEETLSKKMELMQQLGLEFQSRHGYRAFTWLCTYKSEQILARFEYLKTQGFSHDDVCKMTRLQPGILIFRPEYLKQKIHYLVTVLNRNIQEIVEFPAFLSYSLEKRIIPRFDILKQWKENSLFEGDIRLNAALSSSDKKFKERFEGNWAGPRKKKKQQK